MNREMDEVLWEWMVASRGTYYPVNIVNNMR